MSVVPGDAPQPGSVGIEVLIRAAGKASAGALRRMRGRTVIGEHDKPRAGLADIKDCYGFVTQLIESD